MIVLDTCAIIWDALSPEKLTHTAKQAIEQADQNNTLWISDISFWEIAMLASKKRIILPIDTADFLKLYLQTRQFNIQAITPEIAQCSIQLGQDINSDPADRLISATAIFHQAKLVTADQNLIASSSVVTLW